MSTITNTTINHLSIEAKDRLICAEVTQPTPGQRLVRVNVRKPYQVDITTIAVDHDDYLLIVGERPQAEAIFTAEKAQGSANQVEV